MKTPTALDNLTEEARQLWLLLDNIIGEAWVPLPQLDCYLAPLARWMPVQSWRPLFHELGTHKVLAHRVNKGVVEISHWQNRCPSITVITDQLVHNLAFHYSSWSIFKWDSWQDILLASGVETEALWQLNSIYIACHAQRMLESRDQGTLVRIGDAITLRLLK